MVQVGLCVVALTTMVGGSAVATLLRSRRLATERAAAAVVAAPAGVRGLVDFSAHSDSEDSDELVAELEARDELLADTDAEARLARQQESGDGGGSLGGDAPGLSYVKLLERDEDTAVRYVEATSSRRSTGGCG